jgi:hypothetical protein
MLSSTRATAFFFFVLAVGGSAAVSGAAPAERTLVTKDRLTSSQLEQLVAGPMDMVRQGNLEGARRAVEMSVADAARGGRDEISIADTLQAFGVELYIAGVKGTRELQEASVPFLYRSIAAYESAFGADDPEVAVALNSYSDALVALSSGEPPPAAIESLDRAYKIRSAKLGNDNLETIDTRIHLASLRAGLKPVSNDPAASAVELTTMSADLNRAVGSGDRRAIVDLIHALTDLAERYVKDGRTEQATRIEETLVRRTEPLSTSDPDVCRALAMNSLRWRQARRDRKLLVDVSTSSDQVDLRSLVSGDCSTRRAGDGPGL